MSEPVTPTEGRPAPVQEVGLRRLRRLCIAVALACLGALPFELGMLTPPNPAAVPLASVFFGRPTATATPRPTARPTAIAPPPSATAPSTIVIHNYPRTAVVGSAERFSVQLPGQPHTKLIYILQYPDGKEKRTFVRTDGQGRSSHIFQVMPYPARHFRETAAVGVEDASGRVLAFTRFAIQQHT
jgi:hypothetical protein